MGTMAKLWMGYTDLVEIMPDLVQRSQEGNWHLHIAAVEDFIPWCFAYNRTNYDRCLSWYLQNIHQLVPNGSNHGRNNQQRYSQEEPNDLA